MSDPITLVLAGAALGGAAGKFSEIAVESGKNWIGKYFKNHQPKAQERAQQNGLDFLIELGTRIKILEDTQKVTQEKIEKIQEDPDFSAALQKALISSAQTENQEKHKVLAELLAQRLTVEPESLRALTTKMALDLVSFLTPNQLNILGLACLISQICPNHIQNQFQYDNWLRQSFEKFRNVEITQMDLFHLETLVCLKLNKSVGYSIQRFLRIHESNIVVSNDFLESELGKDLQKNWKYKLEHVTLTSVGLLLASNVLQIKLEIDVIDIFFKD
ncbi:LPO_1073/Vpar_1526 family protein [Acinetobacter baumannii]|uniref:LPO_1073/Vpar_1526 family protein n=1 Tax=Acinetobacter nosocomialis TaxID=106654 RepID=UPI00124FDFBE|nr:LPO_1073/Vpar_1526 family protein [Acinetobacter nosocomialis]